MNDNLSDDNKSTRFSSENQPSSDSKSTGWQQSSLLKKIASQLIDGDSKEALTELAKYLKIDVNEIDIETAMHLKQIELALKNGDTKAYNAVMDRIKGKPPQAIDHSTMGEKIQPNVINLGVGIKPSETTS